ncbi:MAG: formate/nitrite transporter family protein [Treponema sp.]|nr:formate/nitrite transporter family protein [Treponema sp.]
MNSPAEIAKLYVDIGASKSKLPVGRMLMLAVFGGLFIAMGGLGSSIASFGVQPAAVGKILGALVFPIGLMMILVGGGELFTGNSLIIMAVLDERATVKGMLRNWLVVYLGNFIGGLFIACVVAFSGLLDYFDGSMKMAVVNVAVTKVNLSFIQAFLRGILCNFMVCIAVWAAVSAGDIISKIAAMYLPIFLFVLCGFEHCVANMYFIPVGILSSVLYHIPAGDMSLVSFIVKFFVCNLLPVTLGNIAGGAIMVGMGYWYVYIKLKR